jgi:nucleotide-binding universal stress UspA family protein
MIVTRFQHLLVGLSGTDTDFGLLRYAAMVVRLGTTKNVQFLHVQSTETPSNNAQLKTSLQADIDKHFAGVPNGVKKQLDVVSGPILDQLLAAAAKSTDLIMIGHRREHPGRYALARRLAMKAPCSVWMVPEGSPPKLDQILVPVDFSDHAADAMRVCTSMAQLAGHGVCFGLHVYFNEARVTYSEYDQVLRGREHQAFESFIADVDCGHVCVKPLFEEGVNIPHVINHVANANNCDLVIMASRGRSPSAAVLLGSVTEETIIETRVPLLVVKHFGTQMGFLQALWARTLGREAEPQYD